LYGTVGGLEVGWRILYVVNWFFHACDFGEDHFPF
jgi:hypothetical protein